jgi:hypothetical protein
MISVVLMAVVAASPGLLPSAQVRKDQGVTRSTVVRDGKGEYEGAPWDSQLAAILAPDGVLEWDLGQVYPIEAALLQGDNNDDFILWSSVDGNFFQPLWRAPQDAMAGLRTRTTTALKAQARYLRLTAEGGDRMYSVSEVMVFSKAAELTADAMERAPVPPPPPRPPPSTDGSMIVVALLGLYTAYWFWSRRQAALAAAQPAPAPAPAETPATPEPPAGEAKDPKDETKEPPAAS